MPQVFTSATAKAINETQRALSKELFQACEHGNITNHCAEPTVLPRLVIRQCRTCLHWWKVYAQEYEPPVYARRLPQWNP